MEDAIYGKEKTITPEEAAAIIQSQNYNNRPLNQVTVNYYAYQMQEGLWKSNGEGIQFSKTGRLLNGQHRLMAIIKANMPIKLFCVYNIDDDAFVTYDQQYTRTAAHLFTMKGYKNANNKAAFVNRYLLWTKQKGDAKTSSKRKYIPKEMVLQEYENHIEAFDRIYEKAEKCYFKFRRLLTTTELGAYMSFLIIQKGHPEEKVYSFFNQLTLIEQPTQSEAINKLRESLNNRTDISRPMKYAYVVKAWNAYITGKEIKILYYDPIKETVPAFL